jgi:catechol 2,3-dioxygenase-like lactoylglutathione lyase family enzyme
MIGYVTLGTNDLARAIAFYDALFAEMGVQRFIATDGFAYWGKRRGLGMLAVYKPNDGRPATVGNGVMVALPVRSRDRVEHAHRKALALGAPDEGAPGPRGENFYGAYFRDPDGNKLCVFTYENGGPGAVHASGNSSPAG